MSSLKLCLRLLDRPAAELRPVVARPLVRRLRARAVDLHLPAGLGRLDLQPPAVHRRLGVDVEPDARRVAVRLGERVVLVGLGRPRGRRSPGRRRAAPPRSAPRRRRAGRSRSPTSRLTETICSPGAACSCPGPVPRCVRSAAWSSDQVDQRAPPTAIISTSSSTGSAQPQPQREPAARVGRQRAQDRGRLAGRGAGARGLGGERVLEVGLDRRGVGVAQGEVLLGHPVEHGGQPGGHLGAHGLHVGQVLAHVLHRDRDLVLAVERDVAGEHLEEHDAERVDVGLAVDVVAERLLGRDVVGRAEHAAVGGQALLLERAGDAEVGDLRRALARPRARSGA